MENESLMFIIIVTAEEYENPKDHRREKWDQPDKNVMLHIWKYDMKSTNILWLLGNLNNPKDYRRKKNGTSKMKKDHKQSQKRENWDNSIIESTKLGITWRSEVLL